MHKDEETPPKGQPQESLLKAGSKTTTIPRYSDKFKEIMTKSAMSRKLCPVEQPQQLPAPVKEVDFFFFRVKSIGVGAHSFVYLVQEEGSKMLLSEKSVTLGHAREIQEDLTREIKLLFCLQHTNIIQLYHVYATETSINLVMEFAEDSLFALKQRFGLFKEKEIIEVLRQLLQALAYLHQQHIVHADIKLENVMIANGTIKLVDFGLAHQRHPNTPSPKPQEVVGTLEYLPPEYAQGLDSGSHRDVWAIGIMAFEMSTGKHPFDGLKENEKWSKLVKNPPESFTAELEEQHKALGLQSDKILELVRGIFQPEEKRWSAKQLLELSFFKPPAQ